MSNKTHLKQDNLYDKLPSLKVRNQQKAHHSYAMLDIMSEVKSYEMTEAMSWFVWG